MSDGYHAIRPRAERARWWLWLLSVALGGFFCTSQPAHAITFTINYESSVTSQPASFVSQFQNAINVAVQSFQSVYNDPITITLNVGWGTVNGQPVTALGQALTVLSQPFTYSQIKTALATDAANATDATALASLGVTDPTNGGNFTIPKASAKALGLIANNATIDGYVGFKSSASFTFDPNNRAPWRGHTTLLGLRSMRYPM